MTYQNPQAMRMYQNLYDCLSDPGELDVIDAIRAADIHLGCSERCHPRRRAQQRIAAVQATDLPDPLSGSRRPDQQLPALGE